ncbi:MAG: hypothetical protein ACFFAY_14480 [Promethearchaeota archaeon]
MLLQTAFTNVLIEIFTILGIILVCLMCLFCSTNSEKDSQTGRDTARVMREERVTAISSEPSVDRTRYRYQSPPGTISFGARRSTSSEAKVRPSALFAPGGERGDVKALRGGEFIGNRMRFKVKVLNESKLTITDVTIWLVSYPNQALRLEDDDDIKFPKIEPGGFRSPHFDLLPTQDCVRGEIVAGVSYIDASGKAHSMTTDPFIIRSVCDLLQPEVIDAEQFSRRLKELECGELTVKVEDWTPEEMYEKTLRILDQSNFYEVDSNFDVQDGVVIGDVSGWAKGKYTGKRLGVRIRITGRSQEEGASCRISMSGEDDAMILPAIDDLKEQLSAWLCPFCGSKLTLENVKDLKAGKSIKCPFCSTTIGR